jgi:O-antigen/teichoic acid export membrane protein
MQATAARSAPPITGANRSLAASGALAFAGTAILNLAGFAFHAIAGRSLGPYGYGMLYAVISVASIAALPAALIAPALSRLAAAQYARDAALASRLTRDLFGAVAIAAGVYIAGFALFGPFLASQLHLPIWALWMTGPIAASMAASSAFRAVAQGAHRFGVFAISASSEGVVKVLGIVGFTAAGMGLVGGIGGFLAGVACGALVAIVPIRRACGGAPSEANYDRAAIAASGTGAIAIMTASSLMGSADVILVKHYFDAQQAGLYSAAALVGKIVLYFVGFIPIVLLPAATARYARGERSTGPLWVALPVFCAMTAVSLAVIGIGATGLLHALVGGAFDAASGLLLWYAAAMALLALATLVASYGIATHRVAFSIPVLAATLGTLVAIAFVHATLADVVRLMVVGNAAIAVSAIVAVAVQSLRVAPAARSAG